MKKGICILRCSKNHKHGVVYLEEMEEIAGVKFTVFIKGLAEGKHGFHIHRKGNDLCGGDSLCDHFNPSNSTHGDLNSKNSHVGDLGNIVSILTELNFQGKKVIDGIVSTEFIAKRVKLTGKNTVFGRSLVVHQDEDDLGKGKYSDSLITGHSGKRILWGIIGVDDDEKCN